MSSILSMKDFATAQCLPRKQGLYDPSLEKDACGLGFVADLNNIPTRRTITDALEMLRRLSHRGARGTDHASGDGAGMLCSIPHDFYDQSLGRRLPPPGNYALGMFFLSKKKSEHEKTKETIENLVKNAGCTTVSWRIIDTNNGSIGTSPKQVEPRIEQIFIAKPKLMSSNDFEKELYFLSKKISGLKLMGHSVYVCSLSTRIVVYKGMLTPEQLPEYFTDLRESDFTASLALVHSRFSTNTFPTWERAQPMRTMAHNGEFNSLKGNINWMCARESTLASDAFGDRIGELLPIIEAGNSDSGTFDNVLEFFWKAGRDLAEAVMIMIPEAWQNASHISEEKKAFYKFYSTLMEPWDGPALVAFTDGRRIGAVLDRNGLRPGRYYITKDNRVICASEVGVCDIDPLEIVSKGRLRPGHLFQVDVVSGTIETDEEVKRRLFSTFPYQKWVENGIFIHEKSAFSTGNVESTAFPILKEMKMFGYTEETLEMILKPMAVDGVEALSSMGNDVPLAFMSRKPRLLFDYFRQLFAQVTNPPIDPIREYIVTSLLCPIGPKGNILHPTAECAHQIFLQNPILSTSEFHEITHLPSTFWKSLRIDITFEKSEGSEGLSKALDRVCNEAYQNVSLGCNLVILSHRSCDAEKIPIMSPLAVSTVHHFLVKKGLRSKTALIAEVGDAREVHDFSVLLGFGVDAIYPYLAYAAMGYLHEKEHCEAIISIETAYQNYRKAAKKGIVKVMAKMGVSCLQSYKGAMIFEALGLSNDVINRSFPGCISRISGATFTSLANDMMRLHQRAFPVRSEDLSAALLPNEGNIHWRQGNSAEIHVHHPQAIALLQEASRGNDVDAFNRFCDVSNRIVRESTIRGCLKLVYGDRGAIPLDDVEPASEIVKRFVTGAMSYGSISREAHSTIAIAMNRIGAKSNTGEGGEEEARYKPLPNGDSMKSAIKQVASGRFGVTIEYLASATEIQIKIAQGAKPGEGGELPGYKVKGAIAKTRRSTPGVGLISPPPHHDIYSIEDLSQLIYDLNNANPLARISVKLVSEVGVGIVAAGVAKGKAGHILISGHEGGTGASRITGIKHAGLPWELGLAETHQTLLLNNLRDRVVLQTDGQIKTGLDIVKAAILGAEEFGFGTTSLITLGCVMMRKCHLNTCPVGIATQDPELRAKFTGQPEHLISYLFLVAEDVRKYLAGLGFAKLEDIVGRFDLLAEDEDVLVGEKRSNIDLSCIIRPELDVSTAKHFTTKKTLNLDGVLDRSLIESLKDSVASQSPKTMGRKISNTDRTTGAMLSHYIVTSLGEKSSTLSDDIWRVDFNGSAGQSFGAYLTKGVTFCLSGDANDYVGKSLSGGKIAVFPPESSQFKPEQNVIAGNVCLYGATSGEAYFRGVVAERFCVRNSGALAVVEGVGDHCCEYMTGGIVVVLGSTGVNFAAGMSGGIAYVVCSHKNKNFIANCNTEMVSLDPLETEDVHILRNLLNNHVAYTNSTVAKIFLQYSDKRLIQAFIKVFPNDFKAALDRLSGKTSEEDVEDFKSPIEFLKTEKTFSEHNNQNITDIEDMIKYENVKQKSFLDHITTNQDSRPSVVISPVKHLGFLRYSRSAPTYRPSKDRIHDFEPIYAPIDQQQVITQASRCMDCGVPFCHQETSGCPLGNRIPEFNEAVYKGNWRDALDKLLATNNFPEFTGRVCPAPCEGACVLGITDNPVTIKNVEIAIIENAFTKNWILPNPCRERTGKIVRIIGSGPCGLAAADQLNKVGHFVTVYERSDRIGGLLMYGVPNMKLSKDVVDRRVELLRQEGVQFMTGVNVGKTIGLIQLKDQSDALLLATGCTVPRDLPIKGRGLNGVHFAMDFLTESTKTYLGSGDFSVCKDKHVVVIGGGDTGNDCIGTAIRSGARSITNFELMPMPGMQRSTGNPWPQWPHIFRVDYGHKEVVEMFGDDPRQYCVLSKEFVDDGQGNVCGINTVRVRWERTETRWAFKEIEGTDRTYPCDLALLSMGFVGPEKTVSDSLQVNYDQKGNYAANNSDFRTSAGGVFAAGDCRRGQSLVVWAISEGRRAARAIDEYLMGSTNL